MHKHNSQIALIVEGEKREVKYFENLKKNFLPSKNIKLLTLPAGENIYVLWKQMSIDDFETDIIEVLREYSPSASLELKGFKRTDFQEVYMFFDYEAQQNNLSKDDKPADEIIHDMLKQFDNETENGKLYISYPMCEALRDIREESCKAFTDCFVRLDKLSSYKKDSAEGNIYVDVGTYNLNDWLMILRIFLARLKCIFGAEGECTELLKWYKKVISPEDIFYVERAEVIERGRVFVLSAFPEFLLDYFTQKYLLSILSMQNEISSSECLYRKCVFIENQIAKFFR